jgi:hypothetical protein
MNVNDVGDRQQLAPLIASRTAWWPWSVQPHIGFILAVAE